jgi:ABC-type polysaccharide/polyol phosphate export permease
MHSIHTANIVLIIIGIALVVSGPYILYRTVHGVVQRRREDPKANLQLVSNFLNVIIAILFFMAGILFVVNNLRGNPLDQ